MLKRNSGGGEGGAASWLNTYADMVTLLLTFFAVLLSMSSVDQEKFNAFIESFSNLPPEVIEEIIAGKGDNPEDDPTATSPTEVEVTEAMDNLYQMLIEYVEQHGMQEQVSIERSEGIFSSASTARCSSIPMNTSFCQPRRKPSLLLATASVSM